ncbi:hypothetical protein BSP18_126 [Bacillus phage BSP18]|nr:hypothetical protein BSP18_126 [Bacillus phage BSP18]
MAGMNELGTAPDEVVNKIQVILNGAFRGNYATAYWTYEQPVDIDIYPYQKG